MPLLAAWWHFNEVSVNELAWWAVVLSALSLVASLWIIRLIYKLARNQVKLAAMLRDLRDLLERRP